MQEKNSERKSGWKRVSRTFNTLAAVLVVAILIGSAVTLVNLRNHAQGTNVGSQKQATPTPTPQPSHDCSHIFTENSTTHFGRFTMADNGEHAVCTQGLEESLNSTAEVNGHKVTLISAYADPNRLLVKWAMSDKISHNDEVLPPTSITLSDGAILPLGDQIWYDDMQNQQLIELVSYGAQQVPASTTSLQITMNFSGDTTVNNTTTSAGHGTFNFAVPMRKEKRVATPNQSVKINGHMFTLDRVVVTESETMFYLKVDPVIAPSDFVSIDGKIDGKEILMGGDSDASGNGKEGNQVSFSGPSEEDFMSKQGVWTLNLQGNAWTPLGAGSGSIRFAVPPAA